MHHHLCAVDKCKSIIYRPFLKFGRIHHHDSSAIYFQIIQSTEAFCVNPPFQECGTNYDGDDDDGGGDDNDGILGFPQS